MTSVLLSPTDVELAEHLEQLGARVIKCPQLNPQAPADYSALDEAIENLFGYDWLILKNETAAEYFLERIAIGNRMAELDDLHVLAVGEATAEALGKAAIHVDCVVDWFYPEAVFEAVTSYVGGNDSLSGLNLLVPCAGISRERFEDRLDAAGARVDAITAYRTTEHGLTHLKAMLNGGGIDCVAFARPSYVDELARLFDTDDLSRLLANVKVACADEATRNAAAQYGLAQLTIAEQATAASLANLIMTSDAT